MFSRYPATTAPLTHNPVSFRPILQKMSTRIMWLCVLIVGVVTVNGKDLKFPPGFKLGVATAAYQIEGGWNASGKGENIWDRLTHTHPELIADHSNGDIACDSFELYQRDVEILKEMNVDFYRFSISWSRVLSEGFSNHLNYDGMVYYKGLINYLLANGIEPVVTLYHWDLPQVIQDLGGWTNPQTATYFADFARIAFQYFGDKVKTWITINEPSSICTDTYEYDAGAPAGVRTPGIGLYLCGKTILLAHAKVYRLYDAEFRQRQGGKVGITIDSIWAEPKTNNTEDIEASERELQMTFGWWAHPIFSTEGDYPEVMKKRIGNISQEEDFAESRLPALSSDEVKLVQGTYDFLGLNHYHTWLISNRNFSKDSPTDYQKDKGTYGVQDPDWKPNVNIVPWGFRKLLNWVKNEYNNPLVIVTENGYGDSGGLKDYDRVYFLKEFMKAVILAVTEDGCNIKGYTVWSIMDNMEWRDGYTVKFGLYDVDFTSPNRTRTPKASASFFKDVIKTRSIPEK